MSSNAELKKFDAIANEWWNPSGKFKQLHKMNDVRASWIINIDKAIDKIAELKSEHYNKKSLIDIGCGGGLLTEKLSNHYDYITGVDASKKAIEVAIRHAKEKNLDHKINYFNSDAETFSRNQANLYDVVLCMELVEHVDNVETLFDACYNLAKKDGKIIFSTINRNFKSYLMSKVIAEYILRMLPVGMHDYRKYVKPSELNIIAEKYNAKLNRLTGIKYNIFSDSYYISSDVSVNYIIEFIKK